MTIMIISHTTVTSIPINYLFLMLFYQDIRFLSLYRSSLCKPSPNASNWRNHSHDSDVTVYVCSQDRKLYFFIHSEPKETIKE